MDPRVKNFIEKSNVNELKRALEKLNLKTSGNKAVLIVRLEEGIKQKNPDEVREIITECADERGSDESDDHVENNDDDVDDRVLAHQVSKNNTENINLESERLDLEISELQKIIEKKRKIAELKKMLVELKEEENSTNHMCSVSYRHADEDLLKFSGDDNLSVQKWMQHFDETSLIYKWNDEMKLIYAKRSMTGTAKLLIRAKSVKTWPELKYMLMKEFKRSTSKAEIHKTLRNRKKRIDENYQQYILAMEEIGSLSDIDEQDIIQYIIDGINDAASNKAILYTADNLDELKNVFKKYEKMKSSSSSLSSSSSSHHRKRHENRNVKQQQSIKCYNCNENGHLSRFCPQPKRQPGSCFRCG